jgi:hypothetical protein
MAQDAHLAGQSLVAGQLAFLPAAAAQVRP